MDIRKEIFEKYDEFSLAEHKLEKDILRFKIKSLLDKYSEKDSNCYHILGLLDYEFDDWKENIETAIWNFKKAIELDKTMYFLNYI